MAVALEGKLEDFVDFGGKSIKVNTEKDAESIIRALKDHPALTALCLSGNTIGVDGARSIGSELSHHKNLERCLFSDMFTGRMVDEIAPALKQISVGILSSGAQLTELDLSDNAFGPRGVIGVTDLLSSPACFSLKILRMNNQGLGHHGAKHLAEALSKGIKESNGNGLRLTHFSAGRNRLENVGACLLADVFSQMQSLEELHLYQNGIGIHGSEGIKALTAAISMNTQMRVLNLSDNSLKAEGGVEIGRILQSIPHLQELILDDCLIRSRGCRALAHHLECEDTVPALSRLSLYGNEIKCEAAVSLAFSLGNKANLTYLSLNANEFGPSGIEKVLHALESVGLLHAIEAAAPSAVEEEQEDGALECMDSFHRAFNEDDGSDGEEVVDEEDELEYGDYEEGEESYEYEENDDEEEEGDGEEDIEEEEEDDEEEEDEQENSLVNNRFLNAGDGLVNRPISADGGVAFSFRHCLSNLQKEDQFRSNLFAGLKIADSTTSGGLFDKNASGPNSSRLFAPPKLGTPASLSSTGFSFSGLFSKPSQSPSQTFDEKSIIDSVKSGFVDTESDDVLATLTENIAEQTIPPNWQLKPEAISSNPPESVVRLAFRICLQSSAPPCHNVARNLLLTALTQEEDAASTSIILPSARAVNRILLHLGAIKPDRSDPVERKIHAEASDSHNLTINVDLVTSLLKHHGEQLGDNVRKPLALLISQHRKQNSALESILDALEGKMSALSLLA